MRIGISTAYLEEYWRGWPWCQMYAGSEHIVVELAAELAKEHEVTVRLPRNLPRDVLWRGVRWVSLDSESVGYDRLFCFDDFAQRDHADIEALVACRSDPPHHTDFDQLIFLSETHARLMGHAGRPSVGGGVSLADYQTPQARIARRVIYTSSPDRGGHHAAKIGKRYDFVASYNGLTRSELIGLQQSASLLIHPCDPVRPSEFFCMAVLEALASGTPCIVSDADALPELWGAVAVVLPRPIDYSQWSDEVDRLLEPKAWKPASKQGKLFAKSFDWANVARKYLAAL